jgi:hypothetical protein
VWILFGVGVAFLLLAVVFVWTGGATERLVEAMRKAVPTKANLVRHSLPGELVSVTGIARSDNPMFSPRGGIPALYYDSAVERDYERTEYQPATKDRPSRTSTHRSTEIMSTDRQWIKFSVEDETGSVHVVPDGAEFDAKETLNRFDPSGGSTGGFSMGMLGGYSGDRERTLGYRYQESTIALDQPVYVVGVVTESGEIASPGSGRDDAALIVSYRDEKALIEEWENSARWQAYGSIGSASIGIVLLVLAVSVAIR